MALTAQKTLSITADGVVYDVERMSQPIKDMVTMMDEFRQQEMDAHVRLTMARGAIRDVQNQLLSTIQQERAEAEQKAAAMGIIPTVAPEEATQDE
jgi:hypothetical protein